MAKHPNVAFIERGFVAFNSADVEALSELISAEATQHMAGSNDLFSGDHHGRDNILAMYGRIGEASGGTFRADPEQILANDDKVVVIYRATAERGGKKLNMQNAIIFELEGDQIVDVTDIPADADEQDAFWS